MVNFSDIKLLLEILLLVKRKLNKTVPKIHLRHPAVMTENRENWNKRTRIVTVCQSIKATLESNPLCRRMSAEMLKIEHSQVCSFH